MRIRKLLDDYERRGWNDGFLGRPPNPFCTEKDYRYLRMAYDCGYRTGKRAGAVFRAERPEVKFP